MMDSFDEKRGMVRKLLDMLKDHASNEVSNGLQKPEGEGDMHGVQVEKVEVLPDHEMDEPTPEHDVITKMSDGGQVDGTPDESSPLGKPTPNRQDGTYHPGDEPTNPQDPRAEHLAEGGYPEAESEPPSMFASFLGKRKKK